MKCLIVIFTIINAAISKPNIVYHGKIINGEDASITELPYQVSVLMNMRPYCGGSILNDHIVLTAAHCTHEQDKSAFSVHVGDTNVLEVIHGQFIAVNKVIQHPDYDTMLTNNDMSLLLLSRKLIFSDRIQPIPLDPIEPPTGAMAVASGWGTTSEGGKLSRNLQRVEVPVFQKSLCNVLYMGTVTDKMVCAGYLSGYYDSCQGDSGGPLALNGKLIGVISFGNGCARPFAPGVYASVANMYSWLQTNLNAN